MIPRQVDDYSTFLDKFPEQDEAKRFAEAITMAYRRVHSVDAKVAQVNDYSRENQHPLLCVMEYV